MKRRMFTVAILALGGLLALSGCSVDTVAKSASGADSDVTQVDGVESYALPAANVRTVQASSSTLDCNAFWTSDTSWETVQYLNFVKKADGKIAQLNLKVSGVDCYDWGRNNNPEIFNGAVLNDQYRAVSGKVHARTSAKYSGAERPWNVKVCTDTDNFPGVGWQQLCGEIAPRSYFGWTPVRCNWALCDGFSMCPNDTAPVTRTHPAQYSRLESTMKMTGTVDGMVYGNLKVRTDCAPLDHTSQVIIAGVLS